MLAGRLASFFFLYTNFMVACVTVISTSLAVTIVQTVIVTLGPVFNASFSTADFTSIRGAGALEVIVTMITTFGSLIYTNSSIAFGAIICCTAAIGISGAFNSTPFYRLSIR